MVKRLGGGIALCAAVLTITLSGSAPAFAQDFLCTSTRTGETISNNIVVPAGQLCQLSRSTVDGNVVVHEGAALVAFQSTISGNVYAEGATVQLIRTRVGNNVTTVRPTNYPSPTPEQPNRSLSKVFFCGSTIGGSVSITDAPSFGSINLGGSGCAPFGGGNIIGGTLLDQNNRTSTNELVGNRATYIVCSGNSPAPTGSGNFARFKTGQCASL